MVPILFRAFSTVVTVLIAVAVSAELGETSAGKVWAAVLIAVVIGVVEWLLIWAPKHSRVARRLLDPRAQMLGTYVQDVTKCYGSSLDPGHDNRFAVFWVDARSDGEYCVTGFAYDSAGRRFAEYESDGVPEFSRDGRSMTYRWEGKALASHEQDDVDRKGLAQVDLLKGTGRVENVGLNVVLLFDLHRVDRPWLEANGLGRFDVEALRRGDLRDEFARAYAQRLASSASSSEGRWRPVPIRAEGDRETRRAAPAR